MSKSHRTYWYSVVILSASVDSKSTSALTPFVTCVTCSKLFKGIVESGASRHADFSLLSLAGSPTCRPCIRGFIETATKTPTCNSEQRILEHVVQLICQETTLDTTVGIRRCIALAYELICSLQDDKQNAFHQSLGTRLMQNGESLR